MNQSNNTMSRRTTKPKQFRIVLYCLFAFIIVSLSLTFFTLSIGRPYMGIRLSINDGIWIVSLEDANGAAGRAGITNGDRPLEINGQPAEKFLKQYEDAGEVFGMLIEELTVISDDDQLATVTLNNSAISWQSMIGQIKWLFVCLTFWVVGFYVFFKRPKNVTAFLLSLFGLVLGLAFSANMAIERQIPSSLWFEVAAMLIAPWILLHFFLVLPEERVSLHNNPLIYFVYLPAVVTLILFPIIGYSNGQPLPWFRSIRLFELGVGFLAVASIVMLDYFRARSLRTRQQMKIIVTGCLAALIPFLILSALPEAILGKTIIPSGFSILFSIFIPLSMLYAVVTKKLMNIDVIIRRGIIYGLITLVMAAMLSVAIFFAITYQDSLGIPGEILIALALGSIATFLFGPLRKSIEHLVDRFFYKDRYDYRQIIQSLGTSLNSAKDLTSMSRLVVGTMANALNLAGSCLFVKTQSGSFLVGATQGILAKKYKLNRLFSLLSQHDDTMEFPNKVSTVYPDLVFLIPLIAVDKEIGFLCVSQKASRQDFSYDDVFLLQGIASVASIALHSALLTHDVSIRDTFVSVASHELRTPLTSVVGYADLLLHRNPPDVTRKQWIKKIFDNSQRLNAIVEDLLNVSRIQSGKINITYEKVKLSELLEEVISLAKEYTNKHEFVINIESDLSIVVVDRDKLSQVVGNLLSNAIKYSPKGGRITLSVYNEPEKHQIIISVNDEGIGISPSDKDSLFTTFHRIQRPETQGIRGNGLGLYIAKEWTEAMGGQIWVESELNKGSTFFVSIPSQDSIMNKGKSYTHSRQYD